MSFDTFFGAQSFMLWSTFIIAFVMGAVVNKTNFCTMGAVSDLVNIGDSGRMRAWILAGTVAMIGVVIIEMMGRADLSQGTLPPYRGTTLELGRYILGGLLFGIGMTLASGCGNKTLIRIGGGNIKSIIVFVVIAVIAYFMVDPFKQLEATWYQSFFAPWLGKASVSLSTNQDLGSIVAGWFGGDAMTMRIIIGAILAAVVLYLLFKNEEFRKSFDNVFAGVVIGLAVILAWYITANVNVDGQSLTQFYGEWDFVMDSAEGKPVNGSTNMQPQSFTFISPIGQTYGYAGAAFDSTFLTFGVMSVLGVILGSFVWAVFSKGFRIEWFANFKDFLTHFIGAILMGFGGVLGLGCTVGQGITGVSTLALGSFLVFGSIVLGSGLTMKIQYYKMVYDDEATFGKALITALVDFKLLPGSMRKLEAI
jgi:uncharacterized membrane protein YedE/YeeE